MAPWTSSTARIATALRAPAYVPRTLAPAPRPPDALPDALLRSPIGAANAPALKLLLDELRSGREQEFWIALVPGSSEQWGHHRAPPRGAARISQEFTRRIARALELLRRGVVRFVLVSGGSVDPARAEYNEALRGRDYLLETGASLGLGDLARRVLVDPLAHTSVANVRNADKLCADVGLDRLLIATSMPPNAKIWPANFPVIHQTNQGWYYLHHALSTFDLRCRRALGYTLGAFEWFETAGVTAIAHHGFDRDALARDDYGP